MRCVILAKVLNFGVLLLDPFSLLVLLPLVTWLTTILLLFTIYQHPRNFKGHAAKPNDVILFQLALPIRHVPTYEPGLVLDQ